MGYNILYIFGGEYAAGAEIVTDRLIEKNREVNPYFFIAPGAFAKHLKNKYPNSTITELKYLKKLNRAKNKYFIIQAIKSYFILPFIILRFCKKHEIDIVHSNTLTPSSYVVLAALINRLASGSIKWIWTDHDIQYFSKFDKYFAKLCQSSFDKTIAVSIATAQKYNNCKKVIVLYNGLDINVFHNDETMRNCFRERLQIQKDVFVFGMAAGIEIRKGQLNLINQYNRLTANCKTMLLLAGSETGEQTYINEVKKNIEINSTIKVLGKVDNILEFYNGIDCLINNSSVVGSEPLGTSIYEAMAVGKIVVAANVGGSKEIITNNIDGILFDQDDNNLMKVMNYVLLNKTNLLNTIPANAIKKVNNKFNVKIMVNNYNAILLQLKHSNI